MADIFGISSAIQGVIEVYFRCARHTGRTNDLVEYVKAGDTVVFVSKQTSQMFEARCRERGIDRVRSVVASANSPESIFMLPTTEGRLIFDHGWLEEHYRLQILQISQRLDNIATQASGYGEPHRETAMQARSMRRWGI